MTIEQIRRRVIACLVALVATPIIGFGWLYANERILAVDVQLNHATVVMGTRISPVRYEWHDFGDGYIENVALNNAHYTIARKASEYCFLDGVTFWQKNEDPIVIGEELPADIYRRFFEGCMALKEHRDKQRSAALGAADRPAITER